MALTRMTPPCPRCRGRQANKHGLTKKGKQQYRCRLCFRVYVADPYIMDAIRIISDRLFVENINVPTAERILSGFVSRRWLYKRRETYGRG